MEVWIPNRMVFTVIVFSEPWLLRVGVLQVQCRPTEEGRVGRLAVSRGLLTCCRPHILLSPHIGGTEVNILKVKKHLLILLCSLLITRPTVFICFRRVYCWKVCFLWFAPCVNRSWIVTTLLLKVRH